MTSDSLGPTEAEWEQATQIAMRSIGLADGATIRVTLLSAIRVIETTLCSQGFSKRDALKTARALAADLQRNIKGQKHWEGRG